MTDRPEATATHVHKHVTLAEACIEAGRRAESLSANHSLGGHSEWAHSLITLGFSLRGTRYLRAVVLLTTGGLVHQAYPLVRALFEMAVNLGYIRQDPGERSRRYLAHGQFVRARYVDRMQIHGGMLAGTAAGEALEDEERRAVISAEREATAPLFAGDPYCWPGRGIDIRKRAEAVDSLHYYDLIYRLLCDEARSGAQSLLGVLEPSGEAVTLAPPVPASRACMALHDATTFQLHLLAWHDSLFGLGLAADLGALQGQLRELAWPQGQAGQDREQPPGHP